MAQRRGPNVSAYIANLNAVHSPQDQNTSLPTNDAPYLNEELAQFTNATFFDFDMGTHTGGSSTSGGNGEDDMTDYDQLLEMKIRRENASGSGRVPLNSGVEDTSFLDGKF
jgi:hypothetical protein